METYVPTGTKYIDPENMEGKVALDLIGRQVRAMGEIQ